MYRVAAAAALLLPFLLAALAGGTAGGDCAYPLAQDDAGSGRDAGAAAATAVAIAEARYDGILGLPLAGGAADLEDRYAVELSGNDETVMVEVYLHRMQGPVPLYAPQPVQLEAWAPGADAPTHVGQVTVDGTVNATFDNGIGGVWHLRVAFLSGGEESPQPPDPGCSAGAVETPAAYSFYFGCNPVCVAGE